jgi:predicted lipid-binding transport protein (Tim44 family)
MRYSRKSRSNMKFLIPLAAVLFLLFGAIEYAEARAGRSGGSFGYRGTRTYSAPVQNAPPRQQQATKATQAPTQQPQMAPRGAGLFGGLAGGLAGGILGGLLFSSLGHAAVGPGTAGGLGFLDILLIGAGIFLIIRFFRRKKSTEAFLGGRQVAGAPAQGTLDAGLGDISRMDGYFDEEQFMTEAVDIFFNVQSAWVRGEVDQLKEIVAPKALETLRAELAALKEKGLVNRVEGLAIRDTAMTEAWQEKGTDYITMKLTASAVDYIADASGKVIEGSSADAAEFTEFWTFAREIGKGWKLSAIQQPS